jgi:hypothetical protein
MNPSESFEILGINSEADDVEIRRAWKEKAAKLHPDVGGTHNDMIRLNDALKVALAHVHSTELRKDETTPQSTSRKARGFVVRDMSCFTIDTLPVDAWQLLYVSANHCGPIIDEEEPYVLEFLLSDTSIEAFASVMCRCEIVPEAGASTVHLSLFTEHGSVNGVEIVRDLLVSTINELDGGHFT